MCLHLNTWSTKLHKMCESLLLFVARLGITERTDNGEACNFLKIQLIDNETNHLFTITMTTWWDTGPPRGMSRVSQALVVNILRAPACAPISWSKLCLVALHRVCWARSSLTSIHHQQGAGSSGQELRDLSLGTLQHNQSCIIIT